MPTRFSAAANRIEDHALIGNAASAALVRSDGTIDWLCLPRFDSPAVFAGLLGTAANGFWRIAPALGGDSCAMPATRRRYLENSLVLEQEWDTPAGSVRVTDFMPAPSPDGTVPTQVIRIVDGLSGVVRVESVFRPRPGYGAITPLIYRTEHDGAPRLSATAAPDAYWLDGPPHRSAHRGTVRGEFTVSAGECVVLSLTWQPNDQSAPAAQDGRAALALTVGFWEQWAARCTYEGPYRDAVLRSVIVLKAMCHLGGGIVAAATTSLPELMGGGRNWDYRYVWGRDSALTVSALVRLGFLDEALAWRGWLLRCVGDDAARMQIMYGLDGERDLSERILDHLPGYENSQPVRIGNAAAGQIQLDVYGEIADALLAAEDAGLAPCADADRLLAALARQVELRWWKPDEGIWEIRGERQHFTHSKVMAWVAIDRTLSLLERRRATATDTLARLRRLREEIHNDVCQHGYDAVRNTFTQVYGGHDLDAALLLIPQVGFLPADDKRVIGTVEAIQRELATPGGLVQRYPTHAQTHPNIDGLAGHEGAFLPCSFWLADALTLIGRTDEARQVFDQVLALRSPLGLLPEEYDPTARRFLGNFPQAFSHWALADTARLLSSARASVLLPRQRDGVTPVDTRLQPSRAAAAR